VALCAIVQELWSLGSQKKINKTTGYRKHFGKLKFKKIVNVALITKNLKGSVAIRLSDLQLGSPDL